MANIFFCVFPLGYLWQQELCVELVDGLDVAEDGGDGLLGEEVLRPALLVHAELEYLGQKYFIIGVAKIFGYFTKNNCFRLD